MHRPRRGDDTPDDEKAKDARSIAEASGLDRPPDEAIGRFGCEDQSDAGGDSDPEA